MTRLDESTTALEAADVSPGGLVLNSRLRNKASDELEILYLSGRLRGPGEPQAAAERRVSAGRELQQLRNDFARRGPGEGSGNAFFACGEIGSPEDRAETIYNKTMERIGPVRAIVQAACFGFNLIITSYGELRRGLDLLPEAMERSRQEVDELLRRGR